MKVKQFFKNSAVYGFSSVLTRIIWFLALPLLTRKLTPETFGTLELVLLLATFLIPLVTLNIGQGYFRFMSLNDTTQTLQKRLSTCLWFIAVMGLFTLSIGFMTTELWSHLWLGISSEIAQISMVYVFSVLLFSHQCYYLRLLQKPKTELIVQFIQVAIGVAGSCYGVWFLNWGIIEILYALIGGYTLAWLVALTTLRKYIVCKIDFVFLKRLLSFSYPLVFAAVASLLATWIDRIMISQLLGLSDLGVYSVAFRMAGIGSMLVIGFQTAMPALFFQHYKDPQTPAKVAKSMALCLALILPVLLAVGLFAEEFVSRFLGQSFIGSLPLWFPLTVAVLFMQSTFFFPGMKVAKKTSWLLLLAIIAAIINFSLNLLLIPIMGLMGAVCATLFGAIIYMSCWIRLSQSLYYIPYAWRIYGKATFMLLLLWFIGTNLAFEGWLEILCKFALLAALLMVILHLKLVSKSDFMQLSQMLNQRLLKRSLQ